MIPGKPVAACQRSTGMIQINAIATKVLNKRATIAAAASQLAPVGTGAAFHGCRDRR
jgi:hypothetical protein